MRKGQGGPHWAMILAAFLLVITIVIIIMWMTKRINPIKLLLSSLGLQ